MTAGRKSRNPAAAADALRLTEERCRALVSAAAGISWTANARGEVADDLPAWRTNDIADEQDLE